MINIILIISLKYIYLNAQGVPYNGTCTFTHDCADWHKGRVICDATKRCTCRPAYSDPTGGVFWNSTSRRCVYCPNQWILRETRCYGFITLPATWSNARMMCQTVLLADLAVFDSVNDLNWFRKYIAAQATGSIVHSISWNAHNVRLFWIGAMNEPFVKYGTFSWIDNRGFRFDQHSSMWCNSDGFGFPQPSWDSFNKNETRVSLLQRKSLDFTDSADVCLTDEISDAIFYYICERTSATYNTKCDTNNMCQNEGICTAVVPDELNVCDCTETPYGGPYCTEKCGTLPSHCQNGGMCTKFGNCSCTSSWRGPLCTEAIDPCLSKPCQHDTSCSQVGNTPNFICDCGDSGWTGELCNITKYPCPAGRCLNNGQCKPVGQGDFSCNCMKTGYQGTLCDKGCHDTDEPCENSGSCINNECICEPLTKGNFCEIIEDKYSLSSQIKSKKTALQIWLIIGVCIVCVIMIIGLIYGRKKLFKSRQQRKNSINDITNSTNTKRQNNENDSISVASSQGSQITTYFD